MLGVDANILLRILLQDDEAQLAIVDTRLSRAIAEREVFQIGPLALAETIWTLRHRKRGHRDEIADAVRHLGESRPFRFFNPRVVSAALDLFETSRCGFSDCLIAATDAEAGCTATLTFDRAALKLAHFVHPSE